MSRTPPAWEGSGFERRKMYGAIIGDIAGSKYEWHSIKSKDFPLISEGCRFTDDTVMTVAVAKALLKAREEQRSFKEILVETMQDFGRRFPHAGYGGKFRQWIWAKDPEPYGSFGNGSAMRVSPCGLIAVTLEEALDLAKVSAEVTHDHPEGIKGAEATAAAVFLARCGKSKEEIRDYIREHYYPLDRTLDEIRPGYSFEVTCQKSVPEAIQAFLESESYEDAIRGAISLGGDSDTQAAIAGAIAWSYYRYDLHESGPDCEARPGGLLPKAHKDLIRKWNVNGYLPKEFLDIMEELDQVQAERITACDRIGCCRSIPL